MDGRVQRNGKRKGGAVRVRETLGAEALAGGRCSVPSDGTSHRISR